MISDISRACKCNTDIRYQKLIQVQNKYLMSEVHTNTGRISDIRSAPEYNTEFYLIDIRTEVRARYI
jgi:hypothetical protein